MIKIIKEGVVPTAQTTCGHCQSVLEYSNIDLDFRVLYSSEDGIYAKATGLLKCPKCHNYMKTDIIQTETYNWKC